MNAINSTIKKQIMKPVDKTLVLNIKTVKTRGMNDTFQFLTYSSNNSVVNLRDLI